MKKKIMFISAFVVLIMFNMVFAFSGIFTSVSFAESNELYLLSLSYSSFEDTYTVSANYIVNENVLSNEIYIETDQLVINVNGIDIIPNYNEDSSFNYEVTLQRIDKNYEIYARVDYLYGFQNENVALTSVNEESKLYKGIVKSETIIIESEVDADKQDENSVEETSANQDKIHIYTTATLITLPTLSLSLIVLLCVYFVKIKKNFLNLFKFSFTNLKFDVSNSTKKLMEINVFGKKERKIYKKILHKTNKLINKNITSLKQKNIESLGQYNSIILNCANLSKTVTAAEKTINKTNQAQSIKVLKYISNKSIPNIIANVNEVDTVLQRMRNLHSSSIMHKNQLGLDTNHEEYMDYLNKNIYNIADSADD